MAEKGNKDNKEQRAARKKTAGSRKRKSSRAMYEELFVNAALAENEHLSPQKAEHIDEPQLLWALLEEYMENPEATTQQRPLSVQLLAACLNMMHQNQLYYNVQRAQPETKLEEPKREYPFGNGGITREDIAQEIMSAYPGLSLQQLLLDIEKNDYFGRII